MNKTKTPMTFRFALAYLEDTFNSTYRGIKTVDEMCETLTDRICWENEPNDKVYHQFETKSGPNRIVADDVIVSLAQSYWGKAAISDNY